MQQRPVPLPLPPPPPPAPPARPPLPAWLWPAAVLVTGAAALGVLVVLLSLDQPFLIGALRVAVVGLVAGLIGGLGLGLRWLAWRAQRAAIVTLQHGQPIDIRDLRALTQTTTADTLARHYAVELTRAAHSAFPALSHYSVRNAGGPAAMPPPVIEGELVAAAPPPLAPGAVLPQLHARGQIGGGLLLAGLSGGTPQQIAMRACGFIAVGGQSRSGKTTTVALLLAQAALHGWHIALCDPFPHKTDGLLCLCQPLSGALFRQAATPDEIAQTIRLVDKIGRRRLEGDPREPPVLLVIEEFSNLVIRRMLPPDVLDLLPAMAMAYASVGVHAIIIGHEFSRALLGERYGATLRRACTHRIIHRLAPDAAEFLLPSAAYARQVVDLQPGRALLWGEDSPTLISIPKVGAPDFQFAAQGRPPRPYAPWPGRALAVAAALPAPPPPPPASLDERIVALLAAHGQARDGNTIAAQLGADLQQVRNALTRLAHAGRISRQGLARSYTYAVDTR